MKFLRFVPLVVAVPFLASSPAAPAPVPSVPPEASAFTPAVKPLLQTYCIKCHNDDTQEGGVNYAAIATDAAALAKRSLWKRAAGRIASGEMPPEGAKPLAPADKERLLKWMAFAAEYVDCDPARRDPGPSAARRLTRAEYDHTVRDLFGFDFDSAIQVGMPADGGGERFDNLAADLALSPTLMDKYFAAADKIVETLANDQGYFRRLLVAQPGAKLTERDAARQIVTRLTRRAFRKPPRAEDVDRLMGFYDRARAKGEPFDAGIRAMLKPVLVSPQFLFRIEGDEKRVNDHDLAVRLSYFLWATMPDDALFALADAGKLGENLDAQITRMLADPKAKALTDEFAVQWLQLRKLAKARPTTEFFPTFQPSLKQAMYDEPLAFFEHLRQSDGSVLDLLDAKYTFANDVLATHYGIAGVTGNKMRRVELEATHHRGGLLGMAAVLTLTSHTFRTSPTQRGKYVLEVVFGTPPPPPPPNAGMIKDDAPKKKTPVTFREQLAQHATQASCSGCHRKIDPLGFALDNYNPIGAWRESTKDNPLDVAGTLPGGETVDGVAGLKAVLLRRKDEFARNVAERMLVYALGREPEPADECAVREIVAAMQKDGYRFSTLIRGVAQSVPFRQRRGE